MRNVERDASHRMRSLTDDQSRNAGRRATGRTIQAILVAIQSDIAAPKSRQRGPAWYRLI